MSDQPYLRPKYRGLGRLWYLYALLWGGIPLCCCLGLWGTKSIPKPAEKPDLIARFQQNRADFDNFVPLYRATRPGERVVFPASFDMRLKGDVGSLYPVVLLEDDCLLLRWRWGPPLNRDYFLIHSPGGLDGIPKKYREAGGAVEHSITPIDASWFHMTAPLP